MKPSLRNLFIKKLTRDQAIQGVVEDALSEGGFEVAIAASGEEAVTLLSGNKGQYQALVTDIGLRGRSDGWRSPAARARSIRISPLFT
jgi:CheY-like chemotaxis protein